MAALLLSGAVWAAPKEPTAAGAIDAARATTRPATRVSARTTTAPTTAPARLDAKKLAEQLRLMKQEKQKLAKVAHFDLKDPLTERPPTFTLFPEQSNDTLLSLVQRLKEAADDKDIRGVLITLRGAELSLSQAGELRDALAKVNARHKPTFVYADSYETTGYVMATGASDICILPGGDLMMPGVGLEVMFARGLLDNIGVKADFIQIGEYKGADEALTRTAASDQLRGEMTRLADSLYGQIVLTISQQRHLKPEAVKGLIDEAIIPASRAKEQKLVDHLVDLDDVKALIGKSIGQQVELVRRYGEVDREAIDLSNPFSLLALLNEKPKAETGPAIGLVYVDGVITEGDGDESLFSEEGTGDGYLRKAMRLAERDDDIKAIVVRISSPGGSALASETAWQAVRRAAAKKPVVISIGGMAASGGYYIASAGDTIFADPTSIVGSIGVVGGKMVLRDLYAKIGITTETFSRGANAEIFSSSEPFTPGQKQLLTKWMDQTYKQFTARVMTTRTGKIKDIDQVAKGRIFLAAQAIDLGMVDRIGGLDQAIAFAADKVDMEEGEYELRMLPSPKTLADLLAGHADARTGVPSMLSPLATELQALPPLARKAMLRQIAIGKILAHRPVVLISPWLLQGE